METDKPQDGESKETTDVHVVAHPRRYMIAARRHHHARLAGITPMTAPELHAMVSRLPGAEIVHVSAGHKNSHASSVRADEATHTYVVKMDPTHAKALQTNALPHVIVEEDHSLTYGQKHEVEASGHLHLQSASDEVQKREVTIRVVGEDNKPVANAAVMLAADGQPSNGTTDEKGEVTLDLLQLDNGPARSLFVRPTNAYWNRYFVSPELSSDHVNVVRVAPLSRPAPADASGPSLGWGHRLMGLDEHRPGAGGRGVRVAIIDSGADASHPLLGHIRLGADMTNDGNPQTWKKDMIGHGSHCAGVIGAKPTGDAAKEQFALRGFAPEAEIHILRIFPGGAVSTLIRALDYCIDHDIDVVNLSLGSPQPSEAVEQRLLEAVESGVACIVAAGNSGGPVQFPAACPHVLAVSAFGVENELPIDTWEHTTQILKQARTRDGLFSPSFSCHGSQVAVCAPGVGIISTVPGAAFAADSGTSMAAPHVAGLAALLLSDPVLGPHLGPRGPRRVAALFNLIRMICSPVGCQDPDNRFGAGVPRLQNLRQLFMGRA